VSSGFAVFRALAFLAVGVTGSTVASTYTWDARKSLARFEAGEIVSVRAQPAFRNNAGFVFAIVEWVSLSQALIQVGGAT
jgi:hypothetical protein